MAINERLIHTAADAAGGGNEAEQGLILHLDANDVDSYDGDGTVWYDISEYDVTIPLSDNADNLELHLNASDSTSYGGSGTTWTDISGNSRNGTIDSTVAATFDKDNGGYFDFRGDNLNDQVSVSYNSALDLTSSGLTIELWCKPDSTGYEVIYNSIGSSEPYNGIQLFFHSGFDYYIYSGGVSRATKTSSGSTVSTSEWGHYVITIEGTASGSNVKTYINGGLDYSNTLSAAYTGSIEDVLLGNYTANSGNYDYDGKLGQVRIYSKELSASEVGQNYRHGRDTVYTNLIPDKASFTEGSVTAGAELELDANDYSGSGNWLDSSGNSNDGTITGATYVDDGNSDYFDFDGSNDYISFSQFDISSSNQVTVELWVNPDSTQVQYANMFDYGHDSSNGFTIQQDNTATNSYYIYNSGVVSTVSIDANKWTHLCVTGDGTSFKTYINGELTQTGTAGSAADTSGRTLNIGRWGGGSGRYWNGKMGHIRIYSSPLELEQIQTNYDATKGLYAYPDLKLHLDAASFDGSTNTPSTWTDSSGNGNNGTITGATFDSELGNWLDFDVSDDKITIANQSAFHSTNSFTYEFWVRKNDTTEDLILRLGDTHPTYYLLYNDGIGYWYLDYASDTIRQTRTGSVSNTIGKWTHVCLVNDPSAAPKIYVNGVYMSILNNSGSGGTSGSKDLILGDNYPPGGWGHWNGDMGQVRFYSSALTADQIRQNYNFTKNNYPNGFNANFVGLSSSDWNSDGYFFTNSGKYLNLGSDTALNFSTNKTISVWVNPAGSSGNRGILGRINNISPYGWVLSQSNGNAQFSFYDSSSNQNGTSNTSLPVNTWTHLAVTYNGSNLIFYKNGSQVSTTSTTAVPSTPSANTLIGRFYSNVDVVTYDFIGKISDVKILDKALTSAEVEAEFNKGQFGEN